MARRCAYGTPSSHNGHRGKYGEFQYYYHRLDGNYKHNSAQNVYIRKTYETFI